MDFNADHFILFGLPRSYRLDPLVLDKRYREIQSEVHPDRFAQAGDSERRLSLQWATRVNEAYQTLRKPLPRAQYLLSLSGHDVDGHSNTAMPPLKPPIRIQAKPLRISTCWPTIRGRWSDSAWPNPPART